MSLLSHAACERLSRECNLSAANNPLLFYMPVCTYSELLLLGTVHGGAGGCLYLWELMRLIPVFHALNYFREEINGVKQLNALTARTVIVSSAITAITV